MLKPNISSGSKRSRSQVARPWRYSVVLMMTLAGLLACASTPPEPTISYDQAVNFQQYETFGFFDKLGTDKEQYSTMLTDMLKAEVRKQLTAKGLEEAENPDLLVNFFTNAESRTKVRSTPSMDYGYYGYRRGYYGYNYGLAYDTRDIQTIEYKVGTLNIDLVDADKKKLVWEGILEGKITQEALDHPEQAVAQSVDIIFETFPPGTAMP